MFKEIEEPWYRPKSKSKEESASYKYSKQANTVRAKRQSGGTNLPFPNSQSVCGLYLKIDPFLYDWIYNREGNQVNIDIAFIRGPQINYVIIPDMLEKAPFFNRIKMWRKFKGSAIFGCGVAVS